MQLHQFTQGISQCFYLWDVVVRLLFCAAESSMKVRSTYKQNYVQEEMSYCSHIFKDFQLTPCFLISNMLNYFETLALSFFCEPLSLGCQNRQREKSVRFLGSCLQYTFLFNMQISINDGHNGNCECWLICKS